MLVEDPDSKGEQQDQLDNAKLLNEAAVVISSVMHDMAPQSPGGIYDHAFSLTTSKRGFNFMLNVAVQNAGIPIDIDRAVDGAVIHIDDATWNEQQRLDSAADSFQEAHLRVDLVDSNGDTIIAIQVPTTFDKDSDIVVSGDPSKFVELYDSDKLETPQIKDDYEGRTKIWVGEDLLEEPWAYSDFVVLVFKSVSILPELKSGLSSI